MAQPTVLAQLRQLKRTEQHLLWLSKNLPKTSVLRRTQLEVFRRRTQLAMVAGKTVAELVASMPK